MMVKWGEEYSRIHPGVRIDLSAGGAGKGIADALAGLVDVGMVSREITPEEIKRGILFVPAARDAVVLTISSKNPVRGELQRTGVGRNTLIDIWINGRNLTWGDAVGGHSKDKIQVYTRSDSCGAAQTWAQFLGGRNQEDLKGVGVYSDPGIAEALRKDARGIGYNNLNFAYDGKTGLPVEGIQVLSIDVNENGRVDAGEDVGTKEAAIKAIVSGAYPSPPARDLYLVMKLDSKEPPRQFVRWILTEGQQYVEAVGYIRLSGSQVKEALKRLEK